MPTACLQRAVIRYFFQEYNFLRGIVNVAAEMFYSVAKNEVGDSEDMIV